MEGNMSDLKHAKRCLIWGLVFCIAAITIVLLYYFHVIKLLELFLCSTYVIYFVGLALLFSGGYNDEKHNSFAKWIMRVLGFVFLILSIALLVFGIHTGQISLFN